MIALEMRNLGGGEILHACPQESLDKPLPCIVFYHGFTSSKLVYSYFAVALAQAGKTDEARKMLDVQFAQHSNEVMRDLKMLNVLASEGKLDTRH